MTRLDIGIELEYQVLEPSEFIFRIEPVSGARQRVRDSRLNVDPAVRFAVEACRTFGNRHVRLHAEPGPFKLAYSAQVEIDPLMSPTETLEEQPIQMLPLDVLQYLSPSRYCPSDRFFQVALQAFGALPRGYARVAAICEWVRSRTRFQVGTTTSLNCAMDTFNSGVGVCRDFAHLTISLCRALNIPARYVSSIDYGADARFGPPDFHACVEVWLSGRWYLVDPTGMCPTTGLVRIATGRDANDVAFATIFGRVMWTMPKIRIAAIEDPANGHAAPEHTPFAVSTSESTDGTAKETRDAAREAAPHVSRPRPWYKPPAQIRPGLSPTRVRPSRSGYR